MVSGTPGSLAASSSSVPLVSPGEFRYLARQPILDVSEELYGYELLFRADAGKTANTVSSEEATQSTFDLSLLLGAGLFTEGYPAFINCTRQVLCSGVACTLPRELAVIEVLEDVPADGEVLAACRALKQAGYTLALDDVVEADDRPELLALADIVKVDFLLTDAARQRELGRRLGRHGVRLLAEKVETHEQFQSARAMGYTLFQGYFFCRPQTMQARDLPSAHLGYMEILRRAYERELDIPALAGAIREEPALMYRLLRYLNSAAFGVEPVSSIVQALNLLGRDEIRKWVSMVAAISLAGPRSRELIRLALTRARFCEQVARQLGERPTEFFLTGLFSLLEAILDRPMAQIVEHVPISAACRAALAGEDNPPGLALRLCTATGRGHWEQIPGLCARLGCTEEQAWEWQNNAHHWVLEMMQRRDLS
jgi:EAL and modified HD-GYP domain-containing signal transduction protein